MLGDVRPIDRHARSWERMPECSPGWDELEELWPGCSAEFDVQIAHKIPPWADRHGMIVYGPDGRSFWTPPDDDAAMRVAIGRAKLMFYAKRVMPGQAWHHVESSFSAEWQPRSGLWAIIR